MSLSQGADSLSKYLHLLKPLRALADNWEIDVANELTEYVDIVDRLSQTASLTQLTSQAGNEVNFAQAALLIQNSASIYSRKVQYLFKLTHETHDFIFHSRLRDDKDPAAGKPNASDFEHDYQCLDNCFTQKDYTMPSDDGCDEDDGDAHLLPRTTNMLPVGSALQNHDRELFTGGGESIGYLEEFDVHSSVLTRDGVLMSSLIEALLPYMNESSAPSVSEANVVVGQEETIPQQEMLDDNGFDYDHDFGGDIQNDYDVPTTHDVPAMDNVSSSNRQVYTSQGMKIATAKKAKPTIDFWLQLDPHESVASKKKYRKGNANRSFKLVEKAIAQQRQTFNIDEMKPINEFHAINMPEKELWKVPKDRIRGLKHPEFSKMYHEILEKRQTLFKNLCHGTESLDLISDNLPEDNAVFDVPQQFENDGYDHPMVNDDYSDVGDNEPANFEGHDEPALEAPIQSFEEMCRQKLDIALPERSNPFNGLGAEAQISARVRQWEERLIPLLAEQKARPEYDVEIYRNKVSDILDRAAVNEKQITFDTVTADIVKYDIPRYFLTILHLANEGKVDIEQLEGQRMQIRIL